LLCTEADVLNADTFGLLISETETHHSGVSRLVYDYGCDLCGRCVFSADEIFFELTHLQFLMPLTTGGRVAKNENRFYISLYLRESLDVI
jgi:hypothetical protein